MIRCGGRQVREVEMDAAGKSVSAELAAIKQELDPACGYMVFEARDEGSAGDPFAAVRAVLPRLRVRVRGCKLYRDRNGGRVVLVVKIDLDRSDRLLQELMSLGLAREITVTVYAYGGRPRGGIAEAVKR